MALPAASGGCFPLVRGKRIRITALDGCYNPTDPDWPTTTPKPAPPLVPIKYAVSSGTVSVALTANIDEGDEINIKNMDGAVCVLDKPCPSFTGYNIEFTFCKVCPCIFSLITGQPVALDAAGTDPVGLRMNTDVNVCNNPFALEMWAGVPGVACGAAPSAGSFGYLLLPAVQPGVIGDLTLENNAISFVVTGAVSKDGNAWKRGIWATVDGPADPATGAYPADILTANNAIDPNDHLYLSYVRQGPPEDTDGCVHAVWDSGPNQTPPLAAVPPTNDMIWCPPNDPAGAWAAPVLTGPNAPCP